MKQRKKYPFKLVITHDGIATLLDKHGKAVRSFESDYEYDGFDREFENDLKTIVELIREEHFNMIESTEYSGFTLDLSMDGGMREYGSFK